MPTVMTALRTLLEVPTCALPITAKVRGELRFAWQTDHFVGWISEPQSSKSDKDSVQLQFAIPSEFTSQFLQLPLPYGASEYIAEGILLGELREIKWDRLEMAFDLESIEVIEQGSCYTAGWFLPLSNRATQSLQLVSERTSESFHAPIFCNQLVTLNGILTFTESACTFRLGDAETVVVDGRLRSFLRFLFSVIPSVSDDIDVKLSPSISLVGVTISETLGSREIQSIRCIDYDGGNIKKRFWIDPEPYQAISDYQPQ